MKDLEKERAVQKKKEPTKKPTNNVPVLKAVRSVPSSPTDANPYIISNSDTKAEALNKFLSLIALGPITKDSIMKSLRVSEKDVEPWISSYTQAYNPDDTFIENDVFPNINTLLENTDNHLILKDKSYKELRPWNWPYYSDQERTLVINNIHNALTRLGFLDTHPLRDKITNEPDDVDKRPFKKLALGGGILISKKPFKRSQTDSPKLTGSKLAESPTKTQPSTNKLPMKRKLTAYSSSEEDDERHSKKNKYDSYTSPSSINEESNSSDNNEDEFAKSAAASNPEKLRALNNNTANSNRKKLTYYNNLAEKFRLKYVEYEKLYNSLKNNPKSNDKKSLVRLFELHNNLSEWKRKLWDYDSESKAKSNIMNLSKHKKTPVPTNTESSGGAASIQTNPLVVRASSAKAVSASPSISHPRASRVAYNSTIPKPTKPKISLDY